MSNSRIKRRRIENTKDELQDILCCTGITKCPENSCAYHKWIQQNGNLNVGMAGTAYSFSECQRMLLIGKSENQKLYIKKPEEKKKLVRCGTFVRKSTTTTAVQIDKSDRRVQAKINLAEFLRVIKHLDSAPWANHFFSTNDKMIKRLIASHLPLIVGPKEAENYREYLVSFIDTGTVLTDARNTIWITNRQQVRTTFSKK